MKSDHRPRRVLPVVLIGCGILLSLPVLLVSPLTSAVPGGASEVTTTAWFGRVTFGEGYSTTLALFNTGSDTLTGNLILTGKEGNPLRANLVSSDGTTVIGSLISLRIIPGGATYLTATALNSGDSIKVGWARLESSRVRSAGVATFQYAPGGPVLTIAGVPASNPVSSATIPVNDDVTTGRATGYAVANPGTSPIVIKVMEVSGDGTGTFSEDGKTVSGTWNWSSCSGTWTGTAPAEPVAPNGH